MSKRTYIFILFTILITSIFFRVYNIDKNSRFIWDESRALVDMHRIWVNKEITFIGPISENNLEMFPSLTYYLLLPSTILSQFDPLGPVYGMIILGLIVPISIFFLMNKTDKIKTLIIVLLFSVFYPLVLTSRWAWNPNVIPFWVTLSLAILIFDTKKPILLFLSGVFMWLSIYHHYLSVIVALPSILFVWNLKKNRLLTGSYIAGSLFALIPISLFEFKNHYFINWLTLSGGDSAGLITLNLSEYISRLTSVLLRISELFVGNGLVLSLFFYLMLVTLIYINKKDKITRYLFSVSGVSIFFFSFVTKVYAHYLYALVPFILFIFVYSFLYSEKNKKLTTFFILVLIVFSFLNSLKLITSYTWQGDIQAVRNATKIILSDTSSKKINVAALQSQDPNIKGQRYRDTVLVKGRELARFDKHPQSDILYVISISNREQDIRSDRSWEMKTFKGASLTKKVKLSNYPFFLYRFEK